MNLDFKWLIIIVFILNTTKGEKIFSLRNFMHPNKYNSTYMRTYEFYNYVLLTCNS